MIRLLYLAANSTGEKSLQKKKTLYLQMLNILYKTETKIISYSISHKYSSEGFFFTHMYKNCLNIYS